MKKLFLLLTVCCFSINITLAQTAKKDTKPTLTATQKKAEKTEAVLKIEHWTLKNGANIYYVYLDQLPIVDLSVIFNAGSAQDQQAFGLATFTNSSFAEGTSKSSANDIANGFAEVGANFSVDASRDMASINLRSLSRPALLGPAVKLFSDVLVDPKLPEKNYNRIKNQILQAIKQQQETPGSIASIAFYKKVYGNTPYAHNPLGTKQSINKITPQQIYQFYKKYYVGNNAIMVIVGNINKAKAADIAEKTVGRLSVGKVIGSAISKPPTTKKVTQVVNYPSSQTSIRIGELGVSRSTPDYFPLKVGNYILGGGPLTSRLFKAIRQDKGLTYFVYSQFILMKEKGPFVISLQTKNQKSDEAITVVNAIVDKFVQDGPTQRELTTAKKHLIGSFPLGLDSNAAILNNVAMIAFYQLPLNFLDTYRDNIAAITLGQIKTAFQKHLQPNDFITVTVGPSSTQSNAKHV